MWFSRRDDEHVVPEWERDRRFEKRTLPEIGEEFAALVLEGLAKSTPS